MRRRGAIDMTVDGVRVLRLRAGSAQVDIAPTLGFSAVSWITEDRERLALPLPLGEFARVAKTGGIPLLHPWANRLRGDTYSWGGREADVSAMTGLKRDGNGCPIHGALLRNATWEEIATTQSGASASAMARLPWDEADPRFAAFPFPHELVIRYELSADTLRVRTVVAALNDPVPLSHGWHPYFRLDGERAAALLTLPSREEVALDERLLPRRERGRLITSAVQPEETAPLGQRVFDHLVRVGGRSACGVRDARGHGVTLRFESGYRYLQVYAPLDANIVCLEPMTAPIAALSDEADLVVVPPWSAHEAVFALNASGENSGFTAETQRARRTQRKT